MSRLMGSRLGPYEVLSPIGAGGMGEVYRARDTNLGRDVAIPRDVNGTRFQFWPDFEEKRSSRFPVQARMPIHSTGVVIVRSPLAQSSMRKPS
jgi:hypothetical protein